MVKMMEANLTRPVFALKEQKDSYEASFKALKELILKKNKEFYRQNRGNIDSIVTQQIDLCQIRKHHERLAFWQKVQAKIIRIVNPQMQETHFEQVGEEESMSP